MDDHEISLNRIVADLQSRYRLLAVEELAELRRTVYLTDDVDAFSFPNRALHAEAVQKFISDDQICNAILLLEARSYV